MMTDSVIRTNRPPMKARRSSVRDRMAKPATAPPMASDPVSPMKILAGEVFHQRKPTRAALRMAASSARSSGSRTGVAAAAGLPRGAAGLVVLPDADQGVGAEHHDRGAGGEAVEAVREVHAVGRCGDDQVGPKHEQDGAEHGAAEGQVQPGNVADQGDLGGRRRQAVLRPGTAGRGRRRRCRRRPGG